MNYLFTIFLIGMTVIIIHELYLCHGINLFIVIAFIERHFLILLLL